MPTSNLLEVMDKKKKGRKRKSRKGKRRKN